MKTNQNRKVTQVQVQLAMLKFYRQEIKRIESEKERINCMINSRKIKQIELEKERQKSVRENESNNNWQEIVITKTKLDNFITQIECLHEILRSYEEQLNKYTERLRLFQDQKLLNTQKQSKKSQN